MESNTQSRPKAPRLYHKKSRTGCQRCRARRVKCDESRPVCRGCDRHSVPCLYDKEPVSNTGSPSKENTTSLSNSQPPRNDRSDDFPASVQLRGSFGLGATVLGTISSDESNDADVFDMPESRARRILELQLLQNFITSTTETFPATHIAELRHCWSVDVPSLALKHDNLLYGILSISALHLLRMGRQEPELREARQNYHNLALREQRRAVAKLNGGNADSLCFASALILIDAFGLLLNRTLEPYSPPMEWLQMARGAGAVFQVALDTMKDYKSAQVMILVQAEPFLNDLDMLFAESNRVDLLYLLEEDISDNDEVWDERTRVAYEKTLSYMGSIQVALRGDEHIMALRRRLMAFSIIVPMEFVEFVQEGRPRALVVLAHFFALAAKLNDTWWIGDTPRREIMAIQQTVSVHWQQLMELPLSELEKAQRV